MKTEKLKEVSFSNKTKQILVLYTSGKEVAIHYGQVGIKKNIQRAWVDLETGKRSLGFEFSDGTQDFMPYDQPLAIVRDPEFLLQTHIELLTAKIKEELKKQGISKRFLATRLGTSDNQIQRLLNPEILNKNLEQLYGIAALLGLEVEFHLKRAPIYEPHTKKASGE
jgi:hypothetical protein